jgi:hypothetical protein
METFGGFAQFLIHLAMFGFCLVLWRRMPGSSQPDAVQRVLLVAVGACFLLLSICDALAIMRMTRWDAVLGFEKLWQVRLFALNIGKTALMLYLVRQVWIKTRFCDAIKGRTA